MSNRYWKTVRSSLRAYVPIFSLFFLLTSAIPFNHFIPSSADGAGTEATGWQRVPEILKRIVPPDFARKNFPITDFGAVEGGKVLCTEAIRKAIDACAQAGGGHVVVPKGIFLTGAVHLKSNVDLHLSEGAVLRFSTDPKDYLPVVHVRWEGSDAMNYSPLIYAYGEENVALTGKGVLDGQADARHWWPWKKLSNDPNSRPLLMKMNDEKTPLGKRVFGEGHYLRPTFVEFYECKNVLIKDVKLERAPFWFLHPVLCSNVTVDRVETDSNGPNTDGCDPESCDDVLIQNCVFNNGDDCIAIKSGRNNDGRIPNIPAKNIIVRDCTMKDGHGGVSIGSEISGGCSDVFIENCRLSSPNLDQAIRIKSNAKRGGVVSDIYARDLKIGEVKVAILRVDLKYDPPEAKGYSFYPVVKDVFVQNVNTSRSEYGLYLTGLPESKISDVVVKDCRFDGVREGNSIEDAVGVKLENVYMNGKKIEE